MYIYICTKQLFEHISMKYLTLYNINHYSMNHFELRFHPLHSNKEIYILQNSTFSIP